MFRRLASWVRLKFLVIGFVRRNLECRYLAWVANRHQDYVELLMSCVAHEFNEASDADFEYEWHTQPLPGYTLNRSGTRTSEICWEAPVCYTVHLAQKPLVGMAVEFRGKTLCIRQLQGQSGAQIPKNLQRWPALFLSGAKNFLNNTEEFTTLRLYAADQRISYRIPASKLSEEEMRRYQQNLRRRYDGTARQEGFKKVNTKYWEWNLSMHKKN